MDIRAADWKSFPGRRLQITLSDQSESALALSFEVILARTEWAEVVVPDNKEYATTDPKCMQEILNSQSEYLIKKQYSPKRKYLVRLRT